MKRKDYTVKTMGRFDDSEQNKVVSNIVRAKSSEEAIQIAESRLEKIGMGGMKSNAIQGIM